MLWALDLDRRTASFPIEYSVVQGPIVMSMVRSDSIHRTHLNDTITVFIDLPSVVPLGIIITVSFLRNRRSGMKEISEICWSYGLHLAFGSVSFGFASLPDGCGWRCRWRVRAIGHWRSLVHWQSFFLESGLRDRKEEGAFKVVLFTMLALWRLCVGDDIAPLRVSAIQIS